MLTIIGELTSPRELRVFEHCIQVRNAPIHMIGKRVCVDGNIRFGRIAGAFFQISKCVETDAPDDTGVIVSGTIVKILSPKPHPRYGTTACLILQQGENEDTRVLVTLIDARIEAAGFNNLSIGQRICVGGYINYHRRGLHILYVKMCDDVDS